MDTKNSESTGAISVPLLPKTKTLLTKRCSVLHKILFYSLCHLLHRLELVFKNAPIFLFPQIPHDVDGHSVEVSPPIGRHPQSCRLPPFSDANMVTWWICSGQSWSSPRWQPESKPSWRKDKANKGVVQFPMAHYKAHKIVRHYKTKV